MATATPQTRHYWIFSTDPHHYHWDTLFVKGKEMWHGAGAKPDAIRALKQVKRGDRVLCYHSAPERALYSIAEVTRDPYPDPHDHKGKNLVADLRAFEKLPRPVTLAEMRANPRREKSEADEECAVDHLADQRGGIPGIAADGGNCGYAGRAAALKTRERTGRDCLFLELAQQR